MTMRCSILTVAAGILLAVFSADVAAQSAGAFARMGFGARGISMGNALVADISGNTSPFYNPALAPYAPQQNAELAAAFMSFDRELQFIAFSAPLRPRAGIAAGLVRAGISGIDGRDGSGYHTREYSVEEMAFFMTFGLRFSDRFTGGVGFRLYRSDYFEEMSAATSVGLNVGLSYRINDALTLGAAFDDLLAEYTWDTSEIYGAAGKKTSDFFPSRLRLGAAYRLAGGRGLVSTEYESRFSLRDSRRSTVVPGAGSPVQTTETTRLRLHDSVLRVGGEYWLAEPFAVRAGLDRLAGSEIGETTPTAGFAIQHKLGQLEGRIDYTFMIEPYAVGTMHVIALRILL